MAILQVFMATDIVEEDEYFYSPSGIYKISQIESLNQIKEYV